MNNYRKIFFSCRLNFCGWLSLFAYAVYVIILMASIYGEYEKTARGCILFGLALLPYGYFVLSKHAGYFYRILRIKLSTAICLAVIVLVIFSCTIEASLAGLLNYMVINAVYIISIFTSFIRLGWRDRNYKVAAICLAGLLGYNLGSGSGPTVMHLGLVLIGLLWIFGWTKLLNLLVTIECSDYSKCIALNMILYGIGSALFGISLIFVGVGVSETVFSTLAKVGAGLYLFKVVYLIASILSVYDKKIKFKQNALSKRYVEEPILIGSYLGTIIAINSLAYSI